MNHGSCLINHQIEQVAAEVAADPSLFLLVLFGLLLLLFL